MAGPGAGWKHGGASLTDRADVGQPGVGMARMAEVINLKAARKAKAQAARETQAAANRAAFAGPRRNGLRKRRRRRGGRRYWTGRSGNASSQRAGMVRV